ncbi:MAG: hypothetical protein A2293_15365 [Elusimicrobia bacterium RIFOXYB2_FULL_49_7]|nr:MAG: hypothetical protein A2293_15365 [Elusimicrobia bacterium RIFOXYB2_FULL_49_7]
MSLENVMKSLLEEMKTIAKTETVIGKEIRAGDTIIVPVTKVSFGVAGGGGSKEKDKEGVGIGGGVSIEPIAFIVILNGRAQLLNLNEKPDSLNKIIDMVPDVLEKITGKKKSEKSDGTEEKSE